MNKSDYSMTELLAMVQEKAQAYNIQRITSAQDVYSLLHVYSTKDKEYFITVTLDGQSKVIEKRVIHIGTLNQSLVHPREVFRPAIQDNAAGIIISHNHPSGTLEASRADIQITQRLKEVSKLVGIELLDHVILSREGYYSFSDEGLL
ncbi:JAB domain-containing protein [Sulfurovum sp. CS9]|uniref:JAB domain-containing protein n=1 Tax=Sulfurovum sp. CS9 TaxID=3391146 RepID=UPI0039ECA09D